MSPVPRRQALRGAALVLVLLLTGCTTSNRAEMPSRSSAAPELPPGWGRIRPLFDAGHARIAARDLVGLRALAPKVNAEGLALLKANLPNVVARPDVPRYLEGRALFGKALLEFARAAETPERDADLPDLFVRLSESWHAWMRALRGLPPERAL